MHTKDMKTQFFRRIPRSADTPVSPNPLPAAPTPYPPTPAAYPPADVYVPVPSSSRRRRPFLKWWLLGLLVIAFLGLAAAVAGGAAILYYSDMIAPGAQVLGTDIGGMTTAEAAAVLASAEAQQTLRLESEQNSWLVAPADLGITIDAAATASQAHAQSRTPTGLGQLVGEGKIGIQPVWQIDATTAKTYLQTLAAQVDVAPVNAGLKIVNGRAQTTPAAPGTTLDVAATLEGLLNQPHQVARDGRLALVTQTVSPTITDVSAAAAQAEALLNSTVSVRAYDPIQNEALTWVVGPEIWGAWLAPQISATDPTQFEWELLPDQAQTFFNARNQALGNGRYLDLETSLERMADAITQQKESVNLRIYHAPTEYVVQTGDTFASIGRKMGIPYPWIQAANPNAGDGLSVGQVITIPSPDEMLPYPVVENKRIVVSISRQRTWVYENGSLKWEWPTSTGITSSPTAPGVFQVQTHEPNAYAANWDLWMPNFMGIYRPVPTSDFMNGFHGFPTRDGANLLWTNNLGTPVTYGCILLSNENAAQLYQWAEQGVVVEIQP